MTATKNQFYVYVLFASDDPTPKYIGKGKATRKEQHTHNVPKSSAKGKSPKSTWIREVWKRGAQIQSKIIRAFDDEEAAYEYEAQLIEMHADTITNSLGGGGGDRSKVTKGEAPPSESTDEVDLPDSFKPPELVQMPECDPKEEAFAQAYIENGGNGAEAYRTAYKPRATTKPDSIWTQASKVYARLQVRSRINELHQQLRRKSGRTLEGLLDEYDENRREALRTSQIGAANGATKGKAELLGYAKGEGEQNVTNNNLVVLGDAELARRIASMLEKGFSGPATIDA